jgi:hypothetical protein
MQARGDYVQSRCRPENVPIAETTNLLVILPSPFQAASAQVNAESRQRKWKKCKSPSIKLTLIGTGGRLAAPLLPHNRAYRSVPGRFDRVNPPRRCRAGAIRDHRKYGCAGLAEPPGVMTFAKICRVNRLRPPEDFGTPRRRSSLKRLRPFRQCRQRSERSLRRIHASRFVSTRSVWQKPNYPASHGCPTAPSMAKPSRSM